MKRNVGTIDRTIRMTLGIVCIYLSVYPTPILANDILRVFVGIFGTGNLLVSLFVFCPLYTLANISTHKAKAMDSC